jgi:hypothetical protein
MIRFAFAFAFAFVTIAAGCKFNPAQSNACSTLTDLGACVPEPTILAQRTTCDGVTSYCDTTGTRAPNLACLSAPAPTPSSMPCAAGGLACVKMSGFVRALAAGPDTASITLQVIDPHLLANGANPAFVQAVATHTTTLDGSVACSSKTPCPTGQSCLANRCWTTSGGVEPLQRACDTDPRLGCVLALSDGCNHSCNDGLYGRSDDGNYCRDDGHGGTCRPRLRWEAGYSMDNVPTNRTLVVRITGPGGSLNTTWVQVLRWNTLLATARTCNGAADTDCFDAANANFRLDLVATSQADWLRLAQESGLTGGVPNGDGAIYGEVRDCDDVRLSGVVVGVKPAAARVTYFAADPLALTPDVSRAASGTDPLGRFAAFAIHAGRVTVDAAGIAAVAMPVESGDGGESSDAGVVVRDEVTSFGRDDIFVYGGVLSMVTINGGLH